mgnify:CR=1 FL=1
MTMPWTQPGARGKDTVEPKRVTQYALNGPGYCPAAATVGVLPPNTYSIERHNDRQTIVPTPMTTDGLIELPSSVSTEVIEEIRRFWGLEESYRRHDMMHKRGFFLWGPPGSGKTCTIAYIVAEFIAMGGVVVLVNSTDPEYVSEALRDIRLVEPSRKLLVVLEDIDAYVENWSEQGVLSLLDGEKTIDGIAFIVTTNYPEKLDGRIVNRPSRFDRVVRIDMPSPEARAAYLRSKDVGLDDGQLDMWVRKTDGLSIAHLKELIVGVRVLGGSFDEVLDRLRNMSKVPKSDSGKQGAGFFK